MKLRLGLVATVLLAACAAQTPAPAQTTQQTPLSMQEMLDAAPASDWRPLDPENTIYMDVPRGRIVIELAPDYAPNHAANVKALAREGYFDDSAIIRSHDNYVVQWARPEESPRALRTAHETLPAEFDRAIAPNLNFTALPDVDTYAPEVGFSNGLPVARSGGRTWLTHCYAMVGAGRAESVDSGGGTELYVVIGQSPRNLDRNVTLLGRVVQGMELLSALPRGTGDLGFYETAEEQTPVLQMRVAADVPASERLPLEALRTDSATFAAVVESRRNRRDDWYVHSAGAIGLCNAPLPIRLRPN